VSFCGERSPTSLDNCKSKPLMHSLGSHPRSFEEFGPAWRTVARKHRSNRAEVVTCLGAWACSLPPPRVRKKSGARKGQHDTSKYLAPGEVSLSPLNERILKLATCWWFRPGTSGISRTFVGEDSFKSWQHQNDHLYAGRAYLSRSRGKMKCSKRFTLRGTRTQLSTPMTWIRSMQI